MRGSSNFEVPEHGHASKEPPFTKLKWTKQIATGMILLGYRWSEATIGVNHLPYLAGWWYDLPLSKMMSQLGSEFPNIWKNKIHVPNHQLDSAITEHTILYTINITQRLQNHKIISSKP